MKRVFRDKRDFMRWAYAGSGVGGASASDLEKLRKEISKTKVPKGITRDGTIETSYKIALKNKIIRLAKKG